jgi:MFS family permease
MDTPRRSLTFLLLYALAWGGGVVAYVPLLTLILPVKIEAVVGADKMALLSLTTLIGAAVASVVNIGVGVLSDRTVMGERGRRPWILAGLILTLCAYGCIYAASTSVQIVLAVAIFQAAVNTMLAPLSAMAADEAPDSQKGMIGGLMGAVYTFGGIAGVLVTASPAFGEALQLVMTGALVTACVAPLLIVSRRRGAIIPAAVTDRSSNALRMRNLARVWIARLLIQVSGTIFFAYLLFYFETVDRTGLRFGPQDVAAQVAWLSSVVTMVLAPLAIMAGRLSDALRMRKPFLIVSAAMAMAGALVMGVWPQWAPAALGYVLFACGASLFLALQGAYAMQLLVKPRHRGRDMGLLNLTNTVPALIAPGLAYLLAGKGDFTVLLFALAGLTSVALLLVTQIKERSADQLRHRGVRQKSV